MRRIALATIAVMLVGLASATSTKTTLSVKGWTCASCAVTTRVALKKLDGVIDVTTDHAKHEVVIAYDNSKVTPAQLTQAVDELGYQASVRAEGPAAPAQPAVSKSTVRMPWEPMSASFDGCSNGACGTRIPNAKVSAQPGAQPGQKVYCPVSGVVLQINASTPKRELEGKPLYLCCDGCARYFDSNRSDVLAARELPATQ